MFALDNIALDHFVGDRWIFGHRGFELCKNLADLKFVPCSGEFRINFGKPPLEHIRSKGNTHSKVS